MSGQEVSGRASGKSVPCLLVKPHQRTSSLPGPSNRPGRIPQSVESENVPDKWWQRRTSWSSARARSTRVAFPLAGVRRNTAESNLSKYCVSFFSRLLLVLFCCPECSDLWAASAYSPPPHRSFYYFTEKHNQSPSSSFTSYSVMEDSAVLGQYKFFVFWVRGWVFASGVTSLKVHFKK